MTMIPATTSNESGFNGVQNTPIFYRYWLPEGEIRAVVVISHGLAEHGGRFNEVVGHFRPLGYAVYALDHRGHGRSGGRKGYVRRFDDFVADLHTFIGLVRERHPGLKLFLLGHSVGGTIAVNYAIKYQQEIDGLILSAPTLAPGSSVAPWLVWLGKLMSHVIPRLGLYNLDDTAICSDPAVVAAYQSDPLVYHGKTSVRLGMEIISAMARARSRFRDIRLPVLLLQGTADSLSAPSGSDLFFDEIGSGDKTYRQYEGFCHELLHEPGKEQVLSDMEEWLRPRLQG